MHQVESISAITPVPEGRHLVHIGPPKTGTSALQGALHGSRPALAEHGVEYAGKVRHSRSAMMFAATRRVPDGIAEDAEERWEAFAESVRSSTAKRVVVSSETLAGIRPRRVSEFVDALGGDIHVVLTLRPFATILASRWQQSVQDELPLAYADWLAQAFATTPGASGTPAFWRRYDLTQQLGLWGPVVGEENITFVVLDPADRGMLLSTFEALLALPAGTLVPDASASNRSFPHPETEMLTAFNRRFTAEGGSRHEYLNTVREAVIRRRTVPDVKEPSTKYAKISTPRWAAVAFNEKAEPWVAAVRESRANVIGDLEHLFVDPSTYEVAPEPPTEVDTELAGDLAYRLYKVGYEHGMRAGRMALRAELRARQAEQASAKSRRRPWARIFRG